MSPLSGVEASVFESKRSLDLLECEDSRCPGKVWTAVVSCSFGFLLDVSTADFVADSFSSACEFGATISAVFRAEALAMSSFLEVLTAMEIFRVGGAKNLREFFLLLPIFCL